MKRFRFFLITAVGLGGLATPRVAPAGWGSGGGWGGRGWGGPRVGVGIGFYGPGPYAYDPYYYGGAPYYGPAVVVRTGYAVGGSVEIDVQRALAHRGYYGGPVDGAIGPQTRAAIRTYQVDRGLPVSGRIDGPLLRSLHL